MRGQAVVLHRPGEITLESLALDAPTAADAVIATRWSGISTGTERLLWSGRMPDFPGMGYPLVPGYESVGEVVEAGPESGLRAGQTVFVPGARCFGPVRGLLHGLPFGVKDLLDTADLPTAYGSPIYAGQQPLADAAAVALCRDAGAVLLGKTVSTELANMHPGVTRNPHNSQHTPGGSSSGSAAAVADGMLVLRLKRGESQFYAAVKR